MIFSMRWLNNKKLNLFQHASITIWIILSLYIISFFSLCDCIYFCDNFNNSLKKIGVLKLTYFANHSIPIQNTETDGPQDWYHDFESCLLSSTFLCYCQLNNILIDTDSWIWSLMMFVIIGLGFVVFKTWFSCCIWIGKSAN